MKVKCPIFVVLVVFLVLVANSVCEAVNTREIDRVRDKGVLDSRDFEIIDNFVAQGVQELVNTRDFTSIAKVRTVILSRAGTSGDHGQYSERFSESAYKYISDALKTAGELTPESRRFKTVLNLLILVDGLEDVRLANLAMEFLNDENTAVCYWAVHSVTNPGIIKKLNSGGAANLNLAGRITAQLKGLVEQASPEVLALMAEFAAKVDIREGEDLLLQIADVRIKGYADWTVEYELLDTTILKLLYSKIDSTNPSKVDVARRFAQLYSYVIQRYINGQEFLTDTQKQQLASVLVEVERTCIGGLLGIYQSVIRTAVENDDYTTLLLEHSRLLGDKTRPGRLPSKLKFDYGEAPDGSRRIAPLGLPRPAKTEASIKTEN